MMIQFIDVTLKPKSCHDASIFIVGGCRYDNLLSPLTTKLTLQFLGFSLCESSGPCEFKLCISTVTF